MRMASAEFVFSPVLVHVIWLYGRFGCHESEQTFQVILIHLERHLLAKSQESDNFVVSFALVEPHSSCYLDDFPLGVFRFFVEINHTLYNTPLTGVHDKITHLTYHAEVL